LAIVTRTDYDAEGRATQTRQYVFEPDDFDGFDSADELDVETPLWAETTDYNEAGQVIETIDRFGAITQTRYDARGNVVETRTQSKDDSEIVWIVTRTAYDSNGRAIATTDPFLVDDEDERITDVDDLRITRTLYDDMGRVKETRRLWGVEIESNEDAEHEGLFSTLFDPNDDTTTSRKSTTSSEYDDEGRVKNTTSAEGPSAEGLTTFYEYDDAGRQTATVYAIDLDHDNVVEVTTDADGKPISGPEMIRSITTYDIPDAEENLTPDTSVTGPPTGNPPITHTTTTVHDSAGRPFKTIFADDTSTQTLYDSAGRRSAGIDQLGRRTDYEYDSSGRLIAVTLPSVTIPNPDNLSGTITVHPRYEYGYDIHGNQTSIVTNAYLTSDGQEVVYLEKGANGADVEVERRSIGEEPIVAGVVTTFSYDHLGRRTERALAGQSHGSSATEKDNYDNFGRIVSHRDFEGQITTYIYDDDASVPLSERNELGRLVEMRYYTTQALADANGTSQQAIHYRYDIFGRQIELTSYAAGSQTHQTSYLYNADGQIETVTNGQGTIQYEYFAATGALKRMYTTADDTSYEYDDAGRLRNVTVTKLRGTDHSSDPLETTYQYDKAGNLDVVLLSNGMSMDYEYDALDRLDEQLIKNGNTLVQSYDYVWLANGQKDYVVETDYTGAFAVTTKIDWEYDALDRLIKETYDLGNDGQNDDDDYIATYSYDLTGNRLKKTLDKVGTSADEIITYSYNNKDQLTSETSTLSNTTTYFYDGNGSQITKNHGSQSDTYSYDLLNHLTSASVDGVSSSYSYDESDNRIKSTTGGESTYFLVDQLNPTGYSQVLEEKSSPTATPTISYVLGMDVIGQATSSDVHYLLYDGHGSTRLLADDTGTIDERYDYDAFGNALFAFTPATILLYTGEQVDLGLNQYYLRARYYQPSSGRFTSFDSLLLAPHKYRYAAANPVNNTDPTGHLTFPEILWVAGKLLGLRVGDSARVGPSAWAIYIQIDMFAFRMATTIPVVLDILAFSAIGVSFVADIAHSWANAPEPPSADSGIRGRYYEQQTNANLIGNFEGIDDWRDRVATSLRTHDRASMEQLLQSIEADARELDSATKRDLQGYARNGEFVRIPAGSTRFKQLVVGIPRYRGMWIRDPAFAAEIRRISAATKTLIDIIPIRRWR
jgi:RHS repeat-associated protein